MPIDQSQLDPSVLTDYEAMGIDTSTFMDFLAQATPDPVTGEVGAEEVVRFMMRNLDNPLVQQVGQVAQTAIKKRVESHDDDFSDFDFNTLASTIPEVPTDGWWLVTLERYAFVDASGNFIKEEDAPNTPGAQPQCFLSCEHSQIIRNIEQITGLPDSKTLLRFIKRCMVTPMPGIRPGLPRVLQISLRLSQHRSALQPFLDNLPAPFAWDIETPDISQTMHDVIDARMQDKHFKFMELAEVAKAAGNKAFNQKDRSSALAKYTEAIDMAADAGATRLSAEQKARLYKLRAICYANRAATYLLEGEGVDPTKALEDAKSALHYNPDYAKGYYRQAKAHEALGSVEKAQEVLRHALSRPALSSDMTLLTLLNELDIQLE